MRILYLCYNDATSALARSQVLPYLFGLAEQGYRFTLLSWQHAADGAAGRRAAELRQRLRARGIAWRTLRYHKRPSLPATALDIAAGVALGLWLRAHEGYQVVHARSYVPAAVALALHRLTGVPYIFDMRGLMADEYLEHGTWRAGSLAYRATKAMERRLLAEAAAIVVLTENIAAYLRADPSLPARPVRVIPCCVELGRFEAVERPRRGPFTLCSLGSVHRYLLAEMLDFTAVAREVIPDLRLLVLNCGEQARIWQELRARGLEASAWVECLEPAQVPGRLRQASAGIVFAAPTFSMRATCPTRLGEYLAAGLPVVTNAGIGDVERLVRGVGVLVDSFTPRAYRAAAEQLRALVEGDRCLAAACRARAEAELSLELGVRRYAELYASLAAGSADSARGCGGSPDALL